jgi:hypothetical protein
MSGRDQKKRGVAVVPQRPPAQTEDWPRDAAVVCRTDARISPDLARRVRNRTLALLGGPFANRLN